MKLGIVFLPIFKVPRIFREESFINRFLICLCFYTKFQVVWISKKAIKRNFLLTVWRVIYNLLHKETNNTEKISIDYRLSSISSKKGQCKQWRNIFSCMFYFVIFLIICCPFQCFKIKIFVKLKIKDKPIMSTLKKIYVAYYIFFSGNFCRK